jgi:hypothetical protein
MVRGGRGDPTEQNMMRLEILMSSELSFPRDAHKTNQF